MQQAVASTFIFKLLFQFIIIVVTMRYYPTFCIVLFCQFTLFGALGSKGNTSYRKVLNSLQSRCVNTKESGRSGKEVTCHTSLCLNSISYLHNLLRDKIHRYNVNLCSLVLSA